METVTNFDDLRGQWMLAHVSYPNTSNVCFAYPQYVFCGTGVKRVPADAFPDVGSIGISLPMRKPGAAGYSDPEWFRREYGSIVAVRIGMREALENPKYGLDPNVTSRYFGSLALSSGAVAGQVEVEKLASCAKTRDLLQVIELDETYDLSHAPKGPVALERGDERVATSLVAVEKVEGSQLDYYGPVELQPASEGFARLRACDDMNGYVVRIDSDRAPEVITLYDVFGGGAPVARFIDGRPFISNRGQGVREDWVTDAELVEKVAQGLRAAKRLKGCTPGDFKEALASCRNTILSSRWERVRRLTEVPAHWSQFGDALYAVMTRPDMEERVMSLALSDAYLPMVKERLLNTEEMKREAAKAEAEANRELKVVKAELEKAGCDVEAARAELDGLRASYEEERERALASTRAELDGLALQVERRRAELAAVETDLAGALDRQERVRERMEGLLEDREGLAAGILRDSVVRSAVDQAARAERAGGAEAFLGSYIAVHVAVGEDEVPDLRIAEEVQEALSERAGRDLSIDETVNLLICLVQSPITVLSGLPGTGKTSLVRALAGALGLAGDSTVGSAGGATGARFVEVGVERGWTSCRDWVGYYNPLSATYEKSDPAVFDAMAALSHEPADGTCPPFVFLLDEMNLSPAEYYWAPFMRACDAYNVRGCRLDLGGDRGLAVPPGARFMATVNFDHTTEALSPRLLDRAWVLRLEPVEIDLDEPLVPQVPDFSGMPAYSWNRLVRAFGATGTAQLGSTVKETLRRVCAILARHGSPVSQRTQAMVCGYLEAAGRFADRDDPEARLLTLDRAIAQKVLPQLSRPATPDAELLLEELANECAPLPLCQRVVGRMREAGADNGFFTYFA